MLNKFNMYRIKISSITFFLVLISIVIFIFLPYSTTKAAKIDKISPSEIVRNVQFNDENTITLTGNFYAKTDIYVNNTKIQNIKHFDQNKISFVLPLSITSKHDQIKVQLKSNIDNYFIKSSNIAKIDLLNAKDVYNTPIISNIDKANYTYDNPFINITGENFNSDSVVFVNDKKMEKTMFNNATSLTVNIPLEEYYTKNNLEIYILQTHNGYHTNIISNKLNILLNNTVKKNITLNYDWLKNNFLVAHAFGGIDNIAYTNSVEAFYENYKIGHRLFEAYLIFSSDDLLVGKHDWNNTSTGLPDTYNTFKENSKFRTMTFEDICNLMLEYDDFYIVTDTKETNYLANKKTFDYITNTINKINPKFIDRIIVQVYNQPMYYQLINNYGFSSYIYTLYQSPDTNEEAVNFVKNTGIKIVTLPFSRAQSYPDFIKSLNDVGCYTFAHTINTIAETTSLWKDGVYGVYTDFLKYDDFNSLIDTKKEFTLNDFNNASNIFNYKQSEEAFINYLNNYTNKEQFVTIFTIKKDAIEHLSLNIKNKLKESGLQTDFDINKTNNSYIGIINGNNVIYEQISPTSLEYKFNINNNDMLIKSIGGDINPISSVTIDGKEYSINSNGFNIVIYDKNKNSFVSSVCFDTSSSELIKTPNNNFEKNMNLFNEYLNNTRNNNYIVVFSIKDEGTGALNSITQDNIYSLGFKTNLIGNWRKSYIAIIDGNNVIYENLSDELLNHKVQIGQYFFDVTSAGFDCGNQSSINIDGKDYSRNNRGINIVVFDKSIGKVIDSVTFDTCYDYSMTR